MKIMGKVGMPDNRRKILLQAGCSAEKEKKSSKKIWTRLPARIAVAVLLAVLIITAAAGSENAFAASEEELLQQEKGSIIKDENLLEAIWITLGRADV